METDKLTMIEFEESFAPKFRELNLVWLKKFFVVEPVDEEMLSNPKSFIIDKGGLIFFARLDSEIVGTFALMKLDSETLELSKMAVDEKYQGKKIGSTMLAHCVEKGRELGSKKLVLYSNTILGPAIHLYEKFGFVEVPMEHSEYKRSNIKMELNL